jgi:hypothetical protein
MLNRRSPTLAAGCSPRRQAGLQWLQPVLLRLWYGTLVLVAGWLLGRSPVDQAHRPPPCRQNGSAEAPPSRQAVPVGLAPVPPIALPRRSRAPAGLQPKRSVR